MNKTDDQLRSTIDDNVSWAEWSACAVFAGLILERIFALTKSLGFEIKPVAIENWGTVAADSLISLGVAGEVLFSRKARLDSDELTRRSEQRPAEAITTAATANERARELALELERERKKQAPRRLTEQQIEAIK